MIKIKEKLNYYINKYDRIIVLVEKTFIDVFYLKRALQHFEKNFLLVVIETRNIEKSEWDIDIWFVSQEEYSYIKKLYYMYEFSDRMLILDDNIQYGSLNNYVSNGLLTKEEAVEALLA